MSNKVKPASTGLVLYRYYKNYLNDILSASRAVAEKTIKDACNIKNGESLSLRDKVQKLCSFSSGSKFWDWFLRIKIAKAVAHLFEISTPDELETIKDITDEKTKNICLPILNSRETQRKEKASQLSNYFKEKIVTAETAEQTTLKKLQVAYSKKATSEEIKQHSIPKWYAVMHIDTSKERVDKDGNLILAMLSDTPPSQLNEGDYVAVFGSEIESFLQEAVCFQVTKQVTNHFGKKTTIEDRIFLNMSDADAAKKFQEMQGEQSVLEEKVHLIPASQFNKLLLYKVLPNSVLQGKSAELTNTLSLQDFLQALFNTKGALTEQLAEAKENHDKTFQKITELQEQCTVKLSNLQKFQEQKAELEAAAELLKTDEGIKTVTQIKQLQQQVDEKVRALEKQLESIESHIKQQTQLAVEDIAAMSRLDDLLKMLESKSLAQVITDIKEEIKAATKQYQDTGNVETGQKIEILQKQLAYLLSLKTDDIKKVKKSLEKDLKTLENIIRKRKSEDATVISQLKSEIQKNKQLLEKYTRILKAAPTIIAKQKAEAAVSRNAIQLYIDQTRQRLDAWTQKLDDLQQQSTTEQSEIDNLQTKLKECNRDIRSRPSMQELQKEQERLNKYLESTFSQQYMQLEYGALQTLARQRMIAQAALTSSKF